MKFNYAGFDSRGAPVRGTLRASAEEAARQLAREMGITVTSVKKNQDLPLPWENLAPGLKDKALFTTLLGQLVGGGGVSFPESLAVAARATTNNRLKAATEDIDHRISDGVLVEKVFTDEKYASVLRPLHPAGHQIRQPGAAAARPGRDVPLAATRRGPGEKALVLPAIILLGVLGIGAGLRDRRTHGARRKPTS
ncbi:MAG: hypothetical protein AB1511_00105 [Deinococcota bacterium]